jgi:N-ethylmaleimide reductase
VLDAVHAKGATMLLQLWHVGRASHANLQPNGEAPVAPSVSKASVRALLEHGPEESTPARGIKIEEIPGIVGQYARAAEQAKAAGFDGVEIHAANGYLIDQFLQDGVNRRADDYGGSIANRTRFLVEVVDAVTAVWGAERIGVRLGPSNSFNGMHDSDPQALFSHVAATLNARSIAYLHVIEPRVAGNSEIGDQTPVAAAALKRVFTGTVIAAGGFNADGARDILERGEADLVAFGRSFISNPDLPDRIRTELPLNAYDRSTFYYGGARGYTDYNRAREIDVPGQTGAVA